ncbi:MAG: helix-turn-helix transcriptional regulator [Myxococcota bacterium]
MQWDANGFVVRLRAIHAKRQIPTDRLARFAGVDRQTLRRHLKGDTKRGPTLATISAYAKALDCSASWLAWGEGEMIPKKAA